MEIERQVEQRTGDATEGQGLPHWKRVVLILSAASVSLGFALRHLEASGASSADPAHVDRAVADSRTGAVDPVAPASTPDAIPSDPASTRPAEPYALALGADLAGVNSLGPSPTGTRSTDRQMADRVRGVEPTPTAPSSSTALSAPVMTDASPGEPSTPWSPLFLKGGLSMFVGFCIGHVLRAFLKLSAMLLGLGFLAMFGLQYLGFLDLDWEAASEAYDSASTRLLAELNSLRVFIAGSLPSAGLGAFGLFAGFKRSR